MVLLIASGCGDATSAPPGQLIVALSADMSIPKDVSLIRVKIKAGTEVKHELDYAIAPGGEFNLPGTLAVVEGSTKNPAVSVEVVGVRRRANGMRESRTFSKAVVTIPSERISVLQVPVQWLCDGMVTALPGNDIDVISSCDPVEGREMACVAGQCQPVAIDASALDTFTPLDVFGGGTNAEDPAARCFPTVECFRTGVRVTPDEDCTVALGAAANRSPNFAIELDPGGDGLCDPVLTGAPCYVPLDHDPGFGWGELEPADGQRRFQLPPAVCSRIGEGKAVAVRATLSCQSKTLAYPPCGPWSAIDTPTIVTTSCGNGELEPEQGEECDTERLGAASCASTFGPNWSGPLSCYPNCTYDTSQCVPPAPPRCSDGRRDPGEECDADDLAGATCETATGGSGTLRCNANCTLDTSACSIAPPPCGNGRLDQDEQCDQALVGDASCSSLMGGTGTLACSSSCTFDTRGCSQTTDGSIDIALRDASARSPDDQPFLRYISIANRYNAGRRGADLDVERNALNKMLNSLSSEASIAQATPVDAESVLYRIDLRDYGWDLPVTYGDGGFENAWEAIVSGQVGATSANFAASFFGEPADELKRLTTTNQPIIFRSDAFVALASTGDLYYTLLGAEPTLSAQQENLGVNPSVPPEAELARAGIDVSMVSNQRRLVERRPGRDGAFWAAFDLIDPSTVNFLAEATKVPAASDGVLAIFTLPNGLPGYFVADAIGARLDRSNVLASTDTNSFLTAVGCMSCHARGNIRVQDELRAFVDADANEVDTEIAAQVRQLFPGQTALDILQVGDLQRFEQALEAVGVLPDQPEPISATALRYVSSMTLQDVVGDFSTTLEAFQRAAEAGDVPPELAALTAGGSIERSAFEEIAFSSSCGLWRDSVNTPAFCF